jgi:hypothetical protein
VVVVVLVIVVAVVVTGNVVTKLRRIRWAEQVEHMGEIRNMCKISVGITLRKRPHVVDITIDGKIILKLRVHVIKMLSENAKWIQLAQDRVSMPSFDDYSTEYWNSFQVRELHGQLTNFNFSRRFPHFEAISEIHMYVGGECLIQVRICEKL